MSDAEFMQKEHRVCDKLNILLMFSVIFSYIGRRNAEELNQLGEAVGFCSRLSRA